MFGAFKLNEVLDKAGAGPEHIDIAHARIVMPHATLAHALHFTAGSVVVAAAAAAILLLLSGHAKVRSGAVASAASSWTTAVAPMAELSLRPAPSKKWRME